MGGHLQHIDEPNDDTLKIEVFKAMVQPTKGREAGDASEAGITSGKDTTSEKENTTDAETLNKKYFELLDSLLHDQKNIAIKKHPELISAYKALEVYEIYFLAGGDWDEVGAIEFKKKMAKTIISKLVKENDLPKVQTPIEKKA
ncbi:MAG: hypothetical protein V7722_08585 [Porticoccus sp.]